MMTRNLLLVVGLVIPSASWATNRVVSRFELTGRGGNALTWSAITGAPVLDLVCVGTEERGAACAPTDAPFLASEIELPDEMDSRLLTWTRALTAAASFGAVSDEAFVDAVYTEENESAVQGMRARRKRCAILMAYVTSAGDALRRASTSARTAESQSVMRGARAYLAGYQRRVLDRCGAFNSAFSRQVPGGALICSAPLAALDMPALPQPAPATSALPSAEVGVALAVREGRGARVVQPERADGRRSRAALPGDRDGDRTMTRDTSGRGQPVLVQARQGAHQYFQGGVRAVEGDAAENALRRQTACASGDYLQCAGQTYLGWYQNFVSVPFARWTRDATGEQAGDAIARVTPIVQIAPHWEDSSRATRAFLARPNLDTFGRYAAAEGILMLDGMLAGSIVRSVFSGSLRGGARNAAVEAADPDVEQRAAAAAAAGETQTQAAIAARVTAATPRQVFVKRPVVGLFNDGSIQSVDDIPLALRRLLGGADEWTPRPGYFAAGGEGGPGSLINFGYGNGPDIYVVGRDVFTGTPQVPAQYQRISMSQLQELNPQLMRDLATVDGLPQILATDARIVAAIKPAEQRLIAMSDIGYPVNQRVVMEGAGDALQTKPANRDAFLNFEERTGRYRMINTTDDGLPLGHIPADRLPSR